MSRFDQYPEPVAPYRAANYQWYTRQLFYEQWNELPIEGRIIRPLFTLKADVPELINFGREYVADADMTGYTTAVRLLKDFPLFEQLMKTAWFPPYKEAWDREIEAMLYSEGMKKLREIAGGEDAGKALQAAKVLIDPKAISPDKVRKVIKRGRPSSVEVEGELKRAAEEMKQYEDDLKRIRPIK